MHSWGVLGKNVKDDVRTCHSPSINLRLNCYQSITDCKAGPTAQIDRIITFYDA